MHALSAFTCSEAGELPVFEEFPQAAHEKVGGVAPGEQADAVRVVGIRVQDGRNAGGLQCASEGGGILRVAESQKLHEEPAVGKLWNAVTDTALFADIQFLIHEIHLTVWHRPGEARILHE